MQLLNRRTLIPESAVHVALVGFMVWAFAATALLIANRDAAPAAPAGVQSTGTQVLTFPAPARTSAGQQYAAVYAGVDPHTPWFVAPAAPTTAGQQYQDTYAGGSDSRP